MCARMLTGDCECLLVKSKHIAGCVKYECLLIEENRYG